MFLVVEGRPLLPSLDPRTLTWGESCAEGFLGAAGRAGVGEVLSVAGSIVFCP